MSAVSRIVQKLVLCPEFLCLYLCLKNKIDSTLIFNGVRVTFEMWNAKRFIEIPWILQPAIQHQIAKLHSALPLRLYLVFCCDLESVYLISKQ